MVLVAGSLLMGPRMGIIGASVSLGLHAVAGHAAWLLPIWLFEVSCRTFAGCRLSLMRGIRWLLLCILSAVTLALLGAAGGWAGVTLASIFVQAFGAGAALLMFATWSWLALRLAFRLLGAERLEVIAGHATAVSRQALAQYRPIIRPTLAARSAVIDTVGETMLPSALPVPAPPIPTPSVQPPPQPPSSAATRAVPRTPSSWALPDVSLLQEPTSVQIDASYREAVAQNLGERLRHFNINATVAVSSQQGAVVSRYEITPGASQGLKPILKRDEDLQTAYFGLRFVPKHGTGTLGVEIPVPDAQRGTIALRTVLDSPAWTDTDAVLPLALGVTSAGDPVVIDLADTRGPHLLAAGTSGSGKSVGVTAMVISLILRNSPDDVQLLIIDPKVVEFAAFAGLPHLLTPPITELNEAVERLLWAVDEMERRYRQFVERGAKNIDRYNERVKTHERLPRIVIVVDEYADLFAIAKNQVEPCIQRLAQKARAAGIHMILATQRPSVDVIAGVIKANFNARIAYKTAQREDSKTIIGNTGAYALLGKGDSLCLIPQYSTELTRVHGAYISEEEVDAICQAWTSQATGGEQRATSPRPTVAPARSDLPEAPAPQPQQHDKVVAVVAATTESDDLFTRAVEFARTRGYVSARQLEGELGVGFNKAQKLFGRMRADGLIKPGGPNNTHQFVGAN
jgi:S-DNA-T family DNA segregation ATPase FtsK/SpoIIIE